MGEAPKHGLATFLIKVAAVTVAALLVMYAAKTWFLADRAPDDGGIVPWQRAAKHVGEYATVEGIVVASRRTEKVCFLNFHPDWQTSFTAVIFASRFDAFPPEPEKHYRGRTVRVSGYIKDYEGKPEIILDSPDQIEVIR